MRIIANGTHQHDHSGPRLQPQRLLHLVSESSRWIRRNPYIYSSSAQTTAPVSRRQSMKQTHSAMSGSSSVRCVSSQAPWSDERWLAEQWWSHRLTPRSVKAPRRLLRVALVQQVLWVFGWCARLCRRRHPPAAAAAPAVTINNLPLDKAQQQQKQKQKQQKKTACWRQCWRDIMAAAVAAAVAVAPVTSTPGLFAASSDDGPSAL